MGAAIPFAIENAFETFKSNAFGVRIEAERNTSKSSKNSEKEQRDEGEGEILVQEIKKPGITEKLSEEYYLEGGVLSIRPCTFRNPGLSKEPERGRKSAESFHRVLSPAYSISMGRFDLDVADHTSGSKPAVGTWTYTSGKPGTRMTFKAVLPDGCTLTMHFEICATRYSVRFEMHGFVIDDTGHSRASEILATPEATTPLSKESDVWDVPTTPKASPTPETMEDMQQDSVHHVRQKLPLGREQRNSL